MSIRLESPRLGDERVLKYRLRLHTEMMPDGPQERASKKLSLQRCEAARIQRRAEAGSSILQMHQFEGAHDWKESRQYAIRDEGIW